MSTIEQRVRYLEQWAAALFVQTTRMEENMSAMEDRIEQLEELEYVKIAAHCTVLLGFVEDKAQRAKRSCPMEWCRSCG